MEKVNMMVRRPMAAVRERVASTYRAMDRARMSAGRVLQEESGQGTTEYAILVGVLVVIAILAIVAFRDRVSQLWDAISSGINSL